MNDFEARIKEYEKVYQPLTDGKSNRHLHFIQLVNMVTGRGYMDINRISGYIPGKMVFFLMQVSVINLFSSYVFDIQYAIASQKYRFGWKNLDRNPSQALCSVNCIAESGCFISSRNVGVVVRMCNPGACKRSRLWHDTRPHDGYDTPSVAQTI